MRKINGKFLVLLVVAVVLGAGAVFGLHRLHAKTITGALLWQVEQAEADGNIDRAAKFLGRYLEFARDDLDQRTRLAMLVSDPQVAVSAKHRSRARFVIEQVLAKDPNRHVLRERLCLLTIASRSFDAAKEHLSYLEKNQPDSAEAMFLAGVWHESQNKPVPAAAQYRRAIQADAGKIDAYIRLVRLLKQQDSRKQGRDAAEIDTLIVAALEKAPHDANVLSLAAQHAQDRGDTRIALRYLEDGLKRHPTEPQLYLALSRIHGQNGKRTEAIAQLEAGLKQVHKVRQPELRWSLANLLLDENRLEDAKKISDQVREGNPVSADYLEARIDMQRGRWFDAARRFERIRPALKTVKELALQIDLYLGACYEQLEEPAQQLTAFQRAAEADPTSLVARRGQANARWALGQAGEALQIYQNLVAGAKDSEEAGQHRIEYVRMLLQSGQQRTAKEWKKIEEDLDELEKTLTKSLSLALVRADVLLAQGEQDRAESLLHAAVKKHPDRHEPWMHLLAIAAAKGEKDAAETLMQSAESRFQDNASFRLAQLRHWVRFRPAEATALVRKLETRIDKFTSQQQGTILQAMTETYYTDQQYADAARVLRRMLQLPTLVADVRVRMQLLEVVLLQDDDAQARAVLKEIKQLEGDRAGGADWSLGEALRLMREGRRGSKDALEQARHLLTVAAAQRPNWYVVVQARAELDELQGRNPQAIANYRRALDLGSRDPQLLKQLIQLLSEAHRFDEVDEVIARMQKLFGTTDDVVKGFVHNAYHRQDYQKAEFLARQLVAKNSQNYRDHLWLGQILAAGGKRSADAEQAFRRAVALGPKRSEAWISLVRYLVASGQHDAAHLEVENVQKAPLAEGKELTFAQCCELVGAYAEAATAYKAAANAPTASAQVVRAAADFFARMGHPNEAEPFFRKIADNQVPAGADEVVAARRGLTLALAKSHRPSAVAEAFRLAGLARDDNGNLVDSKIPDSLDDQRTQAQVLAALNHHGMRTRAIAMLESLQQKNVLVPEDQFLLARLQSQHGDEPTLWAKTRSLLKILLLNSARNSRYLAFAAHMHIRNKEFAEADQLITQLELLERERKVASGGFGSIELRAKALELRGMGSQAVALLVRYADQPEASSARLLLLAGLQGRLGNFKAAIDLCEQVRQTGTNYHEANMVALSILRGNRPTDAQPQKLEQWQRERQRVEADVRAAIVRDPSDVPLRLHLADLMEMQGNTAEVERICREVLREQPAHLVALNNLAWLLARQSAKSGEALTLVNRAIEKHGVRPELLDTRAVILMHRGDSEAAVRDLQRVVNEAPTAARLFHLSQAFARGKNTSAASASLRRAADLGLSPQQLHASELADYQRAMLELNRGQ